MVFRVAGLKGRIAASMLCLNLGACFGGGSSQFSADEALGLGVGMLSLGAAAAGVASAASGSGGYRPSVQAASPTLQRGNGYSQKGAFDDCAALYGSIGASSAAATCRQRSANMGSLH